MEQLLGVGYSAITIYQTRWGLGLDQRSFPLENAVGFSRVRSIATRPSFSADEAQVQYSGGPVYCLASLLFKVSLLAGYLRVAGFNRTYAIVLYVTLGLVTVSQLIFAFLFAFGCSPVARQWDPSVPGTCINGLAMYFAFGGMNMAWDVLIIILPFPILRRLQLDRRNKVRAVPHLPRTVSILLTTSIQAAIAVLYGAGFFVTIVQAIRIQTITALSTYTDSKASIQWSIVEVSMGVVVSCMPALSPLLRSFSRKVSSNSRSRAYGAKSGGAAYGQSQKSGAATGARTPARKSKVLDSIRDDDEMELCEAKNWGTAKAGPPSDRVQTFGGTDDGDSGGRSRTSSAYDPQQQQHITVVHEYTVQRADAKGL
jgi:hypothetical protein